MKHLVSLFLILSLLISCPAKLLSQETVKGETYFVSLDEVRLIAINNNLDIKLARLDSKIKGTELSYKEAVFDTILSGEIGYTDDQKKQASSIYGTKSITNDYNIGLDKKLKSGTDIIVDLTNKREWTNSPFVSVNPYHDSQVEISLTQPIAKNFFGLIDRGNIAIVKKEIKNAELDSYTDIENAMILAEKAYWQLVLAREEFNVKKQMLKKALILFNQYRKKLRIGLVETGDVLAAEANMHTRETDLLMASNEIKTAEEFLRLQLNIKNRVRLFPTDTFPEPALDTTFLENLKSAFRSRRDYISKKNDIEAKDIKLKMKSNSRFPEIDLNATFATNGLSHNYHRALEGVIEDSNPKYYVGIEFKYPLENNEAESEHKKARLEKAKALISLQKTERQIISDIDKSYRKASVNRINLSKMRRIENLQGGKLALEEKRFKYGRSDSDTLIRYQDDLLKARLMTKRAYFDYRVSILDLMAAEDSFLRHIGIE